MRRGIAATARRGAVPPPKRGDLRAFATRCNDWYNPDDHHMSSYQFTLIVEGRDLQSDAAMDVLFENGCDDALVGRTDGIQYLDFDREAPSPETAILSAIADLGRLPDVEVIRLAGGGNYAAIEADRLWVEIAPMGLRGRDLSKENARGAPG